MKLLHYWWPLIVLSSTGLAGWLVGLLLGQLVGSLVHRSVGWVAGWLGGWLIKWKAFPHFSSPLTSLFLLRV
jgi:hypothetical protein